MKKQALEDNCKCKECTYRFSCFTQERVFSDPVLQGLFEALIAKGRSKEEALEEVTNEIKVRMNQPRPDPQTIPNNPFDVVTIQPAPNITIYPVPNTTGGSFFTCDNNNSGDWAGVDTTVSNDIQISYTMTTGEVINWSVGDDSVNNELRIYPE